MSVFRYACVLAFGAAIVGCGSSSGEEEEQSPVTITAVTVESTTLQPTIDLVGTIVTLPERTATLTSQVAGQVSELCVVEGQAVKKGDPLVRLDSRELAAELRSGEAALEVAKANVALAEQGPMPAEIEAVRQDARTASATAEGRRAKLKALEALHAKGEIADVQYEIARSAVSEAEAAGQAAAQRLKTLEIGTRPELIAQAKAQLQAAESSVAIQQLHVEMCTIAAPFDGVVTQLPARLGTYVEKPTALATVADMSKVFARARIPGDYLSQVRVGAKATVQCDSAGAIEVDGTVARIGKEAELSSSDVVVNVEIDNGEGALLPGLSCQVRVFLPEIPDAISVPASAIADREGIAVVTIVRDGKAYEAEVETGTRTDDAVQITNGVSAGDVIATSGGFALPEGTSVTISDRDM